MKTLLVTGTDTEVGKTYVSCLLLRGFRNAGMRVGAWKPVCSGAINDDAGNLRWSDVELLSEAVGGGFPREMICPQTFRAAVAPNVAAVMEGGEVDESLIASGPSDWEGHADFVLVEGAGGLLSPLSDTLTTADVAKLLSSPVVIVAANRLGVINHTLMTVEVARQRGLKIEAIVLNNVKDISDDESRSSNLSQLQTLLPDEQIATLDFDGDTLTGREGKPIRIASFQLSLGLT